MLAWAAGAAAPLLLALHNRLGRIDARAKGGRSKGKGCRGRRKEAPRRSHQQSGDRCILKKAMNDPEKFKLESALVIDETGAVCYEFRAPNSFGAIIKGQAVLARDGKQFLLNTDSGFSKLWNRECAGKRGIDAAAAIRWFAL